MDLKTVFVSDWLKMNDTCKHGDIIKFTEDLSAFPDGVDERGNPKIKLEGKVEVIRDGKSLHVKKFSVNRTNRKAIQALHGSETKNWVGKELMVNQILVNNPKTGQPVQGIAITAPNVNIDGDIVFQ